MPFPDTGMRHISTSTGAGIWVIYKSMYISGKLVLPTQ